MSQGELIDIPELGRKASQAIWDQVNSYSKPRIEWVGDDGKILSELKFSNLHDHILNQSTGEAAKLNEKGVKEKFAIRYIDTDSKGKGTIQVTLKSSNPNPAYSSYQDSANVTLYEVSKIGERLKPGEQGTGIFVSQEHFILTPFQNVADSDKNQSNHLIHANLDSEIKVSYTREDGSKVSTQAKVSPEYTYTAKLVVFVDEKGKPLLSEEQLKRIQTLTQEPYTVGGFKIKFKVTYMSPPPGMDIYQDFKSQLLIPEDACNQIESIVYFNNKVAHLPEAKEFLVIFWGNETLNYEDKGLVINKSIGYSLYNKPTIFIGAKATSEKLTLDDEKTIAQTIAHEIGHKLLHGESRIELEKHDLQGHYHGPNKSINIMNAFVVNPSGQGIDIPVYFNANQFQKMKDHTFVAPLKPQSPHFTPNSETVAEPTLKVKGLGINF